MPTFTNQATLSYNAGVANSNIVTGEIIQVLSATKTVLDSGYRPGDPVTYIVTLVNSGTAPYNGLTVTDDLGAYALGSTTVYPLDYSGNVNYYVNGTLQPEPAVTQGPPLVFSGISVPAGGNALLIYQATPNGFAPLGVESEITNTATVNGAGLTAPITASATLAGNTEPQLSISKTLSPTTVSENGTITYTFLIENRGATAAEVTDNLSVTDTFDPILSNLTVTLNGVTLTSPADYTYDAATGLFTTVPGRITVPAATFTQDPVTGAYTTVPGTAILQVTGTV
ncbi:MAG: DUF11 domain-containing protein [Clostridia bacterium]|nr:DUF11 domain-containing protein [Clostridia bacterium]